MRDSDVRAAVRHMLYTTHAGDDDTRIVEEMGIWSGSVRIDIAVINGELSGFELKSDRDTLARLPQQAELYSRVFDRVTLVAGKRHVEHATKCIPPWWGIFTAVQHKEVVKLTLSRRGRKNPSLDPFLVAQLLWRDEALSALERFGCAQGVRSKPVRAMHERLAGAVPIATLCTHVRSVLKTRAGWLGQPISDEGKVTASDVGGPL